MSAIAVDSGKGTSMLIPSVTFHFIRRIRQAYSAEAAAARLSPRHDALFPFAVESAARNWPGVHAAALAAVNGRALLFVEGGARDRDQWRRRASEFGNLEVVAVDKIPMDRRHRSKPDFAAMLAAHGVR
jgi:hypothetical protein